MLYIYVHFLYFLNVQAASSFFSVIPRTMAHDWWQSDLSVVVGGGGGEVAGGVGDRGGGWVGTKTVEAGADEEGTCTGSENGARECGCTAERLGERVRDIGLCAREV